MYIDYSYQKRRDRAKSHFAYHPAGDCTMMMLLLALSYATAALTTAAAAPFTLSKTLGDHAVLQNPAVLHGSGTAGATVTTSATTAATAEATTASERAPLTQLTTTVGADGIWRQPLPTMPEGFTPHSFNITSAGSSLALSDILFGKTLLCSGELSDSGWLAS